MSALSAPFLDCGHRPPVASLHIRGENLVIALAAFGGTAASLGDAGR